MSEPKTRPTDASVTAFLARQPEARHADCQALVAMMQAATGEPPVIWGDAIVGFGRYAHTLANGKSFDWPVIGFSPRKQDLTLYLMSGFDGHDALMAGLGKHKTSKACLYIKRLSDIDLDVLSQLVATSVELMEPRRVRS